jgi:hypothetical protein
MSKKVNFAARPTTPSPATDQWVSERAVTPPPAAAAAVPMKRLTIDLEATQHTRFKTVCAQHGLKMADELRRLLEIRIAEIEHGQGA